MQVSSELVLLPKFWIIFEGKKIDKNSSDIIDIIIINCVLFFTFSFNFYMQNNEWILLLIVIYAVYLLDKIAANEWQLSISFQYEGVCFKFYYKLITTWI